MGGSEFAGFSETKPWLKVNQNKGSVNVKLEQEDANSIFNFYKQLIQLRKIILYLLVVNFVM